jgi:hypothetical protein
VFLSLNIDARKVFSKFILNLPFVFQWSPEESIEFIIKQFEFIGGLLKLLFLGQVHLIHEEQRLFDLLSRLRCDGVVLF